MPSFAIVAAAVFGVSAIFLAQVDINKTAMRFFRDVARSKSRKRLHGNKNALIPMLLGTEEPYVPKSTEDMEAEDALTMTLEDLAEFDGSEEGTPLYLAINRRVYDVSAGGKFYAEGGKYRVFVGRDSTRAFALGCTREECISSETDDLTEAQWKEVNRWIELYETHDKYKFVGTIVEDPVDALLENESDPQEEENIEEENSEETFEEGSEEIEEDNEAIQL